MKFLKLVNIPMSIFTAPRYGKWTKKGPIPWINMGFSALQIQEAAIQYTDENENVFTYLPISDEEKAEAILPLITEDIAPLIAINPDKTRSSEILEDTDYAVWKATAEAEKQKAKDAAEQA